MADSYTSRDIVALRKDLVARAKELTNDWTDFNESDLGMVFIELMAGMGDMLGFYLDKQALECFLGEVKQRKNGKGILSITNYKFRMTKSATAEATLTLSIVPSSSFVIPKYTPIPTYLKYNGEVVYYCTAESTVVNKGETTVKLPIIQGKVMTKRVLISQIDGTGKIYLDGDKIEESSVSVLVDDEYWEEVPDVWYQSTPGKYFSIHETKDDKTYVYLHPDYQKYLPIDTTMYVTITYLDSIGSNGAISEEQLYRIESDVMVDGSTLTEVSKIQNYERSSSGAERETLDSARKRSRDSLCTMDTCVVREDYELVAETYPGVKKATAIDWSVKDSKYVGLPYVVRVYVLPENGDTLSEYDLSMLKSYLDARKTSSIKVYCMNAVYKDISLDIVVHTSAVPGKYAQIDSSIRSALDNMFSPTNMEFGKSVTIYDLMESIQKSNQLIGYADINIKSNIDLESYEYPRLSSVHIKIGE